VPRIESGAYRWPALLTKHKEENFANIARAWSLLAEGGTLSAQARTTMAPPAWRSRSARVFGLDGTLSKFHLPRLLADTRRKKPTRLLARSRVAAAGRRRLVAQPSPASSRGIAVDDGSALLAAHLPTDILAGHVADFGCGWGYLRAKHWRGHRASPRSTLSSRASRIEAARANITDTRASFHWLDLTRSSSGNLRRDSSAIRPFHAGRAADRDSVQT
jgi:16S rRNA (guanine1207-N2)-methyltransferase